MSVHMDLFELEGTGIASRMKEGEEYRVIQHNLSNRLNNNICPLPVNLIQG